MRALGQLWAIVAKDLLIEWRTRDLLATMMVLGLTSVVLFNFAVDFAQVPFRTVGPPVLWMAFLFTAIVGLSRSFGVESRNGCLEGLLLAPVDRSVLYAGKLAVNFIVLCALQALLVGLAFFLLNQGPGRVELAADRWPALAGIVALGTLGFAAVGTLFAVMAQRTRRAELLLPVLQSILSLPVLVLAVLATRRLLDVATPVSAVLPVVKLAAVFDVLFVAIALVVFEAIVED